MLQELTHNTMHGRNREIGFGERHGMFYVWTYDLENISQYKPKRIEWYRNIIKYILSGNLPVSTKQLYRLSFKW